MRPFAFWLTGTMQLLRNLMLEGHYRNFARSGESQGGECIVDILGFKPLGLVGITDLVVAQLQIHRTLRLAKIAYLD